VSISRDLTVGSLRYEGHTEGEEYIIAIQIPINAEVPKAAQIVRLKRRIVDSLHFCTEEQITKSDKCNQHWRTVLVITIPRHRRKATCEAIKKMTERAVIHTRRPKKCSKRASNGRAAALRAAPAAR
jgi:hypothetical protein